MGDESKIKNSKMKGWTGIWTQDLLQIAMTQSKNSATELSSRTHENWHN